MATIRGVNLGGWFVLEQWMRPELFKGISGPDETVFCLEHPKAHETLLAHWEEFITEKDIIALKAQGINSVRVPIPWWLQGEAPYFSALVFIDRLMEWCDKHQLPVLLDLHTTPGCQNGFDNGGITGQIEWHKHPENITLTIDKLAWIVNRYHEHSSFWGIEVVNEPHWTIPLEILQDFYRRSYQKLRTITNKAIVFHDGFRPDDMSWKSFFQETKMDNVFFDLHLYLCFDPKINTRDLHGLAKVAWDDRSVLIESIQSFVPVIIGEWSLGIIPEFTLAGKDNFQQDLAMRTAMVSQLQSFELAYGWYFWNYTIWRDSHVAWDFKRLTEKGVFPRNLNAPLE